jgi:hypothetical protein
LVRLKVDGGVSLEGEFATEADRSDVSLGLSIMFGQSLEGEVATEADRSDASSGSDNDDETSLLDVGLFGLTSAAEALPPRLCSDDRTQEETEQFLLPPFLVKILLATGLFGATTGVICTLAVQKLCRELSKLNWAWCPTRVARPLQVSVLTAQDFETSGLFDAPVVRHECRLPPTRQGLTDDAEVQTERPWPPPLPIQDDIQSVWISGAGERFHLLRDCRGLRTARQSICKTRCLMCG